MYYIIINKFILFNINNILNSFRFNAGAQL